LGHGNGYIAEQHELKPLETIWLIFIP
jgi:hypothetical protein